MRKLRILITTILLSILTVPAAFASDDPLSFDNSILYGVTPISHPELTELTDGDLNTAYSIARYEEIIYEVPEGYIITHISGKTSTQGYTVRTHFYSEDDEELFSLLFDTGIVELEEPTDKIKKIVIKNTSYTIREIREIGIWGFHIDDNDFTPPESPQITKVIPGDGRASVNWMKVSELDLHGYNIYVNGIKANTELIPRNDTYYDLTGLENEKSHIITLTAVDYWGNESDPSDPVTVTPGVNFNLIHGKPFRIGNELAYEMTDGNYSTNRRLDTRSNAVYTFDWPVTTTGFLVDYTRERGDISIRMKDTEGNTLFYEKYVTRNRFYDVFLENVMYLEVTIENPSGYIANIYEFELYGNWSDPDDVPPEVPKGLQVEPGDGQATATWLSNSEIDLKGYNIYVNGSKHNLEPISGTRYTISGLQNGQSYDVQISAVDFWGNESELSDPVRVTLEAMIPTPRNLRGRVREENSSIVLEWTDGHPDVQGFNVYRKIERPKLMMLLSLNPADYEKLNDELVTETRYTVPFDERGKIYEFAVTSVNVQGKESEPAKLSVMVPTVPNVISTDRGWGFTAGDIFYNAMVIVASLALFVLLGLAIYMAPRLIHLIRKATG